MSRRILFWRSIVIFLALSALLASSESVSGQGILAVMPAGGFHSEALPGQPFNPPGQAYIVQNTGAGPIDWTVSMASGQDAFLLSKTSGTLLPGQVDAVIVTVNAGYPFTPGIDYSDTVQFNNVTNTQGNTSRVVDAMVIDTSQGILAVMPAGGFHSEALPGHPFKPSSKKYKVRNTGAGPIDWTVSMASGQNAFLLLKTSGTLLPGQVDAVIVTVNAGYPFTPGIDYSDAIQFNNVTNTQGNASWAIDAIVIDTSQGNLAVMPVSGFHSKGVPGHPFKPSSKKYKVRNTGGGPIDWTASMASGQNAFLLSKTSGTLLPGQVDVVMVTVNMGYPFTLGIDYSDAIQFNNVTNTQGNTSRALDAIVHKQGRN